MQNNVKLSRAYYGTDWIFRSLFWINLKGFEIYIKSIIGEFFSAAWLMRFQENQLKPAQISSNFNYLSILSQLWQSRSRVPGPKCLRAVPDDPPTCDLIQFRWKWTFLWHHWGHLCITDLSWKFMDTFTQNKAEKCVNASQIMLKKLSLFKI